MHKHGGKSRLGRWKHHLRRNKKAAFCSCLIFSAGVLLLGVTAAQKIKKQEGYQVSSGNPKDVGDGYRSLTYDGKDYQYNNRVTAVLYAGLDSGGELEQTAAYGDKARADSILLLVLDEYTNRMSVVSISRDTMTQVHRFTRTGKDMGVYRTHIGYAYAYGDGGKVSCENLRKAVSDLFGGLPVHEYIVSNQTSIPMINDLVGGVTVTVPNDDLKDRYPELVTGASVTLDESNVKDYLQYRDTALPFSNEGRMERQRSYILSYADLLKKELRNNLSETWDRMQELDSWMQTSITKNKYLSLADAFDGMEFTADAYYVLEGEDKQGELHDEFYYDEEALQKLILKLFYLEI